MARQKKTKKTSNWANLGFEEKLWQAADKTLRDKDSREYKHGKAR